MSKRTVKENGDIIWRQKGVYHREDGPAKFGTYAATTSWWFFGTLIAIRFEPTRFQINPKTLLINGFRHFNFSEKDKWFETLSKEFQDIIIWNPEIFENSI